MVVKRQQHALSRALVDSQDPPGAAYAMAAGFWRSRRPRTPATLVALQPPLGARAHRPRRPAE